MSLAEGGAFNCGIHNLNFTDKNAYDEHCLNTGHKFSGTAPCVYCQNSVQFNDKPYTKSGAPIFVVCKRCNKAQAGEPDEKETVSKEQTVNTSQNTGVSKK